MVSMSDMKYDAIVGSGIRILKRYDIPGEFASVPIFLPYFRSFLSFVHYSFFSSSSPATYSYPRALLPILVLISHPPTDHLIPPDSRVEIDAKIAAGYFSSGKQVKEEDLVKTVGRAWEETEH
jgi:hypothetical protein